MMGYTIKSLVDLFHKLSPPPPPTAALPANPAPIPTPTGDDVTPDCPTDWASLAREMAPATDDGLTLTKSHIKNRSLVGLEHQSE